jgi:hypothetical protein
MTTVGLASRRVSSRAVGETAPGPLTFAPLRERKGRTRPSGVVRTSTTCSRLDPELARVRTNSCRKRHRTSAQDMDASGRRCPTNCRRMGVCLPTSFLAVVSRCQVQSCEGCPTTAGASMGCHPNTATRKPFCHGLSTATRSGQSIKSEPACMGSSHPTPTSLLTSQSTLYPNQSEC